MGRFLQTDPMGYADSMNLYQAFNMNPFNFVDPMGENKQFIEDIQGQILDLAQVIDQAKKNPKIKSESLNNLLSRYSELKRDYGQSGDYFFPKLDIEKADTIHPQMTKQQIIDSQKNVLNAYLGLTSVVTSGASISAPGMAGIWLSRVSTIADAASWALSGFQAHENTVPYVAGRVYDSVIKGSGPIVSHVVSVFNYLKPLFTDDTDKDVDKITPEQNK
jgi:hypothetical protein